MSCLWFPCQLWSPTFVPAWIGSVLAWLSSEWSFGELAATVYDAAPCGRSPCLPHSKPITVCVLLLISIPIDQPKYVPSMLVQDHGHSMATVGQQVGVSCSWRLCVLAKRARPLSFQEGWGPCVGIICLLMPQQWSSTKTCLGPSCHPHLDSGPNRCSAKDISHLSIILHLLIETITS